MRIRLSDHFTYGRLLRYTFPSMVMMVFTSIYSIVDDDKEMDAVAAIFTDMLEDIELEKE